MTDPDDRLDAFWAEDEPPARDHAFVVAVMERAAQKHLAWDLAGLILVAIVGAIACWAAWPAVIRAGLIAAPALASPAVAVAGVCLTLVAGAWLLLTEDRETPWS